MESRKVCIFVNEVSTHTYKNNKNVLLLELGFRRWSWTEY